MGRVLFILMLFLGYSANLIAQERVVHGVVHTLDSIPLVGVEIQAKSNNQSALTDSVGRFSIVCNNVDKLRIKALGFYNQKIKVTEGVKFVALNMKLRRAVGEQQHVIGYGSVSAQEKTSAVESVSYKEQNFARYSNIYELIRSQFSGVEIVNNEVVIRGGNRTLMGSSAALIVIDGVITENDILGTISPLEVRSLNVLKDGSASVYGARGGNGVLLIETKKGGENK